MAASDLLHVKFLSFSCLGALLGGLIHGLVVRAKHEAFLGTTRVSGLNNIWPLIQNFFRIFINESVERHGIRLIPDDDLLRHFYVVVRVVLDVVDNITISRA